MAWIYLIVAAVLEVGWTFSMKFLDLKKLAGISWNHFFSDKQNIILLSPLLGYIILGAANAYLLALSMKHISPSVALAVWMGISLFGVKLVDTFVFGEPYSVKQLLFFALILAGIIGLKNAP